MMHVGDIMSTMGVFSTVGEKIFCYLSTAHGTHDIPHSTQISKDGIPPQYSRGRNPPWPCFPSVPLKW